MTKCCDTYYEIRTLLQSAATVFSKCVGYNKIRRYFNIPQNTSELVAPFRDFMSPNLPVHCAAN